MLLTDEQRHVISHCKQSITWFLTNFGKLKHPSAGVLPFKPFKYQKHALKCFREQRFNIFRKCRQAGVSKIAGAYALWFAMFHSHKTILIVSRTDADAMQFLAENIVFLFRLLPQWMQDVWKTPDLKWNEHEVHLANGSKIRSLTSSPDVLRSNASSLNIIDEAAFIDKMDVMWAGGWSTLQHGGSVIVISTTNGQGNWYHSTWSEAEAGRNNFNPIVINWWDMDWIIEYVDPLSRQKTRIAPADGIRKTGKGIKARYGRDEVELDPVVYGQYWSPWLEDQYRGLVAKGEGWKFDQEVLASFVGSGNTVLAKTVIAYIETTINDNFEKITGIHTYVHPATGAHEHIDFTCDRDEGLWIWRHPVRATPMKMKGRKVIEYGTPAHSYVMGVDLATGKAKDYHAIEIFDIDEMEQAAELMVHCLPGVFVKMVDWLGRYYNSALTVVERNNGGDHVIDDLQTELIYPRLWRRRTLDDKPKQGKTNSNPIRLAPYGFHTGQASKATINKFLQDYLRDKPGEGYTIYSRRLHKQIGIYVRKKDRAGRDTGKTEAEDGPLNFDDLVMATGLALIGAPDATSLDATNLLPATSTTQLPDGKQITGTLEENQQRFINRGGPALMVPLAVAPEVSPDASIQMQLEQFTLQLGGIPLPSQGDIPSVVHRRNQLKAR